MIYKPIIDRMKSNITDGSEFNNYQFIEEDILIGRTNCDYCNKEILSVWDKHNKNNWFPYLGNQARRPNTYKYSKIINIMRSFDESENKIWNNSLLNVHARAHSEPNNWKIRGSKESVRLLCNSCFQETYYRIKVQGDGILYALSVVTSRNETIESVMKDLNIQGKILGKGAIDNYE